MSPSSFLLLNARLKNWNLVSLSAKTMQLKGFGIRKCHYRIYIDFSLELRPLLVSSESFNVSMALGELKLI